MFKYLAVITGSLLAGFLTTPLFRKIALYLNITDKPGGDLKTHAHPVPYLGGVAIALSFFIVLFAVRFFTSFPTGTLHNLRGILIGGMLILLTGLIDDYLHLDYKIKLFFQIIAALVLVLYDIKVGFISNKILAVLFTVFWVVGITNAFNIIDIMDGLSAGVAVIASLAFSLIAFPTEQYYVNFASLALAGSCLGFLYYNWEPARIYMGDTGSLFIGFILSAISLGSSYTEVHNIAIFAPFIVLGLPIYDTMLVIFYRVQKGKSIFKGSPDHFAIRMSLLGFSKKEVVELAYLLCAFLGIAAFLITIVSFQLAVVIYLIIIITAFLLTNRLSYARIE